MTLQPLQPWKVLSRRTILTVHPWLEVASERVQLPSGQIVDDFYAVRLPDYAMIVALAPDGRVIAERHYQHALRTVELCLPAGYLDDGEDPLHAAQRELREETGYASDNWVSLGRFVPDTNRGCGIAHFYLARGCTKVCEPDSGDLEEMQIELLPMGLLLAQLRDAIRAGRLQEMSLVAVLSLAQAELADAQAATSDASRSGRDGAEE